MPRRALFIASMAAVACATEDAPVDVAGGAEPSPVTLSLPAVHVEPGVEETSLCATLSIDNAETWWVSAARFRAGPGWHHSEWFTVPAGTYPGPDGVWSCAERGFELADVALTGGVLFAQSTQATVEEQRFAEGAALAIPVRSQLVVQLHVINSGEAAIDTAASLELTRVAAEKVQTALAPMAFSYQALAIPPGRSQVRATCDLGSVASRFQLYWVLPHYHGMGTRFSLESLPAAGPPRLVYETTAGLGEPLGGALDPVIGLDEGLRFGCDYQNPTTEVVGFGPSVDDEMCIFLAFSDAGMMVVGAIDEGTERHTSMAADGVPMTEAACDVYAWPYAALPGR